MNRGVRIPGAHLLLPPRPLRGPVDVGEHRHVHERVSTATRSAIASLSTTPVFPSSRKSLPRSSRWIAFDGDIPSRTSCANSLAWLISVHGNPPASVPNTTFTPAFRQLSSDFARIFGISPQIGAPERARGSAT